MLRRSIFFSLVIALLACCSCSYRLGHSYHRTISHFTSRGFRLSNSVNARRTNSRQDVAVSTPKTGAGRVGTATKISGTINQKPHTPFPGGKTPSKSEQKARFNLDMNRPRVQRLYSPEERVETTALSVGQKLVGRVISVTEFGMFIDVGTKRDALLHIKDISKDYFVENIEAKFIPGQDLEVWIKFIDSDRGKVGLQMYPLDSQLPIQLEKVSFEDLQVQQELPGVVVKFSKFGAYLDIGMKQPAFLNRRMMKINRRQRNYQPWEILSTGTVVTCYVHSLDKSRGRVSLTTYEPSKWMERLPASISSEASFADDDEEDLIDDNEELGGDTRAANLRALERTLSLSIDDDDDDDEDTGTDSSLSKGVEEVLSVEEIRRLTKGRDAKILIDDVGTEESSSTSKSSKSDRNIDKSLEPDYEMSSEELFEEIGNGKSQIYMKDLKKWDYLRDLLDDKAVDNDTLKKIFKQASRGQTALDVDQFDEFVDLLAESLEFDDVDEDFDETSLLSSPEFTSIRLDDKTSEVDEDEELRDLEFVVDGKSLYKKEDDEIKKFLEEGKLQDLDSNVEVDLEKAAISSAVAESLYTSLVGKKKTMEFSDVLGWTLVQSLLKEDKLTTSNVMDIFNLCSEGKDVLVPENFAKFVSLLADMEKNMRLSEESTSVAIDLGRSNISEEDEDGLDEELLKSVFQSLSNGKGFVTVKDLLNWDMVLDLLGEGLLDEESLAEMVNSHKTSKKGVDLGGFDRLVDSLVALYGDSEDDAEISTSSNAVNRDPDDDDELEMEDFDEWMSADFNNDAAGRKGLINSKDILIDDFGDDELREAVATMGLKTDRKHTINDEGSDDDEMEDDDDHDEITEIDISEEFEDLSNGAGFITYSTLREWDIIKEIMSYSDLTEKQLQELVAKSIEVPVHSVQKVKFDLEQFEAIADAIVSATDTEDYDIDEE